MSKYEDYHPIEEPKAPVVTWHHFMGMHISKTGDFYNLPFKMIYKVRRLEVWWHIPLRSRYVSHYFLEHLSWFKGYAKRRKLCTFTWEPFSFKDRVSARYQTQVKVLPVEGEWRDG